MAGTCRMRGETIKSHVTDVMPGTATLTRWIGDKHSELGWMARLSQKLQWDAGLKKADVSREP